MKFNYQYRTPDNRLQSGSIDAPTRDAAYVALKRMGIRPSRVVEAPGFFNHLFGKGKRWIAICVLMGVATLSLAFAMSMRRKANEASVVSLSRLNAPADRHQIYGEPALMERLGREDYASVFDSIGDRYLAHFAQPGRTVSFTNTAWRSEMACAIANLSAARIEVSFDDVREVRELKQIVLGMREELHDYLSNGVGTCATFVRRVEERQQREIQIYIQAKEDLKHKNKVSEYERINASLRRIGLPTILVPDDAE